MDTVLIASILGTLILFFVIFFVLSLLFNFGRLSFALKTLSRLQGALRAGKITEVQFRVMMNELHNPRDFLAIKEVSDWLDEQGL